MRTTKKMAEMTVFFWRAAGDKEIGNIGVN